MSDWRSADLHTTLSGEWYYYAGAFYARYQTPKLKAFPRLTGSTRIVIDVAARPDEQYALAADIGEITFVGDGDETRVYIHFAEPIAEPFWRDVVVFLERMASMAREFRRDALGQTFKELLDDYYARKDRGERVKLKALAEEAGVNYGSLRQAKFRYDEERRKNARGD